MKRISPYITLLFCFVFLLPLPNADSQGYGGEPDDYDSLLRSLNREKDASELSAGLTLSNRSVPASSKVKIRLLTDLRPEYLLFSVTSGEYELDYGYGSIIRVLSGENIIIARYDGKIAVKIRGSIGMVVDSLIIRGLTGNDYFSLRTYEASQVSNNYSGDLWCFPDLETIILINDCDLERYVAGVVKAEGGNHKNEEYFKTQAVIARTYTYKYFNKHINDRFNLCDEIHCQAFDGITTDSIIINAVADTRDLVITTADSSLIMAAFHSNCGGETAPSEYVWLTGQPYLSRVIDPYCLGSRNAIWRKKISLTDWEGLLKKNGYRGDSQDPSGYNFEQSSRVPDYTIRSFALPLRIIRSDLDLRSTFFSVYAYGDSVLLRGRGYGHGVGLCQEGAMVMSLKGFTFKSIIGFYYPGVRIISIQDVKKTGDEK